MNDETPEGLGRRDLLKRGAILGGAVVWTAPAVQTLASPAFAATSPVLEACELKLNLTVTGGGGCVGFTFAPADCCAGVRALPNPATDPIGFFLGAGALIGTPSSPGVCASSAGPVAC